jgi:type I restriction enzyme S subunit
VKGAIKQLGEICRFEYGSSLPAEKREEGPHPVFGSNGLVGMHSSPVTDGPTIIVGRKGSAGSVNYSVVSCFPIDTTYFIDRTTAKCDLKWLFYALNNLGLNRLNQAAAVPGLNRNLAYIQSLFVPECPDDQKRIAAILDKADEIRRKRQQALRLTDDFLRSVFLDMFGDPLENPRSWPTRPFGEIVSDTKLGLVRSSEEFGWDLPVPYVRMDAITNTGTFQLEKVQGTKATQSELAEYGLKEGDFLFNTRNSKELVGKVAVYPGPSGATFNNNLMRVRFLPGVDPYFICHQFQFEKARKDLETRKQGTTSVYAVYWRNLSTMPILAPPAEEQRAFRSVVEKMKAVRAKLANSAAESAQLFSSLQQRAFSGQL